MAIERKRNDTYGNSGSSDVVEMLRSEDMCILKAEKEAKLLSHPDLPSHGTKNTDVRDTHRLCDPPVNITNEKKRKEKRKERV